MAIPGKDMLLSKKTDSISADISIWSKSEDQANPPD
jgi:hypothetical protein